MGYRNYSTEKGKIVDPNGLGDFTTIQSAINASSSGDTIFVRNGTYTEDITLIAGLNIVGMSGDNQIPQINIIGKVQASYSGTSAISFLNIETNGDFAVEVTGSNATILNVNNCTIVASDNTAINNDNSNASTQANFTQCTIEVSDNTVTAFSSTTSGALNLARTGIFNNASTSVRSSATSGAINLSFVGSTVPITLGGTVASNPRSCTFGSTSRAIIPMIFSTSAPCLVRDCEFASNTVAALQVDSGGTHAFWNCDIFSLGGTNALVGTGSIIASNLYFLGGSGITITSISPINTYAQEMISSAVSTTSGTTVTFSNLNGVTSFRMTLANVSLSGNDELEVLLGDAGGFITSGYTGTVGTATGTQTALSTSVLLFPAVAGVRNWQGVVEFNLVSAANFIWAYRWNISPNSIAASTNTTFGSGFVTLNSALTQARLQSNGASTFATGTVNIISAQIR